MKKIILLMFVLLFCITSVMALQQYAGTLVIPTPIGGENSTQWGLLSDEEGIVEVTIKVTGDIVDYIEVPNKFELLPKKTNFLDVKAIIPENVNSTEPIRGMIFAKLSGGDCVGGCASLGVQVGKNVIIEPYIPTMEESFTLFTPINVIIGLLIIFIIGFIVWYFIIPRQ